MRRAGQPFAALLRSFIGAERGIAAVEFAMLAPILLVIYLGAVDLTQGLSADRKLGLAVSTVSDLVARKDGNVTLTELNTYFSSVDAIMRPFDGDEVQMRLSIVKVDAGGNATVADTETFNGAEPLSIGSSFELTPELATLARDRYVVVAEGWHSYQPMIGYVFQSDMDLYKRSVHMHRFERDDLEIADNGSGNANAASGTGSGGGGSSGSGGSGTGSGESSGGATGSGSGASSGSDGGSSGGGGRGGGRGRR